ncbi:hypothetical protein JTE90_014419 [Oedothorax gibbosus]|uniref:Uncharacterized protein n=1 Tax=Oedothorax gibbosus TaxID=931172 RepID=A0AAV6TR52_9ARAC|nr:hypothetical protein JTE90_014419 [Oedothorax gibbosus]
MYSIRRRFVGNMSFERRFYNEYITNGQDAGLLEQESDAGIEGHQSRQKRQYLTYDSYPYGYPYGYGMGMQQMYGSGVYGGSGVYPYPSKR